MAVGSVSVRAFYYKYENTSTWNWDSSPKKCAIKSTDAKIAEGAQNYWIGANCNIFTAGWTRTAYNGNVYRHTGGSGSTLYVSAASGYYYAYIAGCAFAPVPYDDSDDIVFPSGRDVATSTAVGNLQYRRGYATSSIETAYQSQIVEPKGATIKATISSNAKGNATTGEGYTNQGSPYGSDAPYISFYYSNKATVDATTYNNADVLHFGGESVVYAATLSDSSYSVAYWTANGVKISGSDGKTSITYALPSEPVEISAVLVRSSSYITVKSENTAYVAVDGAIDSAITSNGATVSATASTATGSNLYGFKAWYANFEKANATLEECELYSEDAVLSYNAEGKDATFIAAYELKNTKLTVSRNVGDGTFSIAYGTVSETGKTSYEAYIPLGTHVTLETSGTDASKFLRWSTTIDGATSTSTNTRIEFDVSSNNVATTATAMFVQKRNKSLVVNFGYTTATSSNVAIADGSESIGTVSYGDTDITSVKTITVLNETEHIFSKSESSKFYSLEDSVKKKWVWHNGTAWKDVATEAPAWASVNSDGELVVNIPYNDTTSAYKVCAVFYKKTTYTVTHGISGENPFTGVEAKNDGCLVEITPAPDRPETNQYLEGTEITITLYPAADWNTKGISVNGESSPYVVKVTKNLAITAIFAAKTFPIVVKVDEYSESVGNVSIKYRDSNNTENTVSSEKLIEAEALINSPITISAVKASNASEGVAFYDWSMNGIFLSNETNVVRTVKSGAEFVARFSARITVDVDGAITDEFQIGEIGITWASASGEIKDSATLPDGTAIAKSFTAVCGDRVGLTATIPELPEGETAFFLGWYDSDVLISDWGTSASFTVGNARNITAKFAEQQKYPVFRLRHQSNATEPFCSFDIQGVLTENNLPNIEGVDTTLVNELDFFCNMNTVVQVTAVPFDANSRFLYWQKVKFGNYTTPGTEVLVANYSESTVLRVEMIAENVHFVPIFWTGETYKTYARLTTDSEANSGSISISGANVEYITASSVKVPQGDRITLQASPSNGYMFKGWFTDEAGEVPLTDSDGNPLTTSSIEVYPAADNTYYYAKFVNDTRAIYIFDESETMKTAKWRSKRVVTSAPINFSTAVFDSEGYGDKTENRPTLTVYEASSPDVPCKRSVTYTFADSNSRRLALSPRAEKAFEFEVVTQFPVNKVCISTSVSEIIGGA